MQAIDEAIVKFDLYGTSAPGQDLTNYYLASTTIGGVYPESASDLNMAPSGINIQSGDIFKVTLTYDGSNLTESITDTSTNANFTHTYTGINLPSIFAANTAFVGFGGGTGAATMGLAVNSWTYTEDTSGPSPTATPTATSTGATATVTGSTPSATSTPTATPTAGTPGRRDGQPGVCTCAGCFDAGANQRLSRGCEPERETLASQRLHAEHV